MLNICAITPRGIKTKHEAYLETKENNKDDKEINKGIALDIETDKSSVFTFTTNEYNISGDMSF